jgi:hypothetical protein
MKFVTSKDHFNYIETGINSNIYFITFGGGYKKSHSKASPVNYHKAAARICKEAVSLNIFNKIYGITENYLLNGDYWKKHGKFTLNNHRGFGYWLWKPYIINKLLEKLSEGDILIYADSGCGLHKKDMSVEKVNSFFKNTLSINTKYNNLFGDPYLNKFKWLIVTYITQNNKKYTKVFKENEKILISDIKEIISAEYGFKDKWINVKDKLLKYINKSYTDNILSCMTSSCDYLWSKADLRAYLKIDDKLAKKKQNAAGRQIIIKNKETTQFLKSWYDICVKDNYRYIDDTPSIIPNPPNFKDNRHDQSVFSLLTKKYNYKNYGFIHGYIEARRYRSGGKNLDLKYLKWVNS